MHNFFPQMILQNYKSFTTVISISLLHRVWFTVLFFPISISIIITIIIFISFSISIITIIIIAILILILVTSIFYFELKKKTYFEYTWWSIFCTMYSGCPFFQILLHHVYRMLLVLPLFVLWQTPFHDLRNPCTKAFNTRLISNSFGLAYGYDLLRICYGGLLLPKLYCPGFGLWWLWWRIDNRVIYLRWLFRSFIGICILLFSCFIVPC